MLSDGVIPKRSTIYMDISCRYGNKATLHPFAYRTHTHTHGGKGVVMIGWVFVECLLGVPMGFVGCSNGFFLVFQWVLLGVPMGFVGCSNGFCLVLVV